MNKTISIVGSAVPQLNGTGNAHPYPKLLAFLQVEGFEEARENYPDFLIAINHNKKMYKAFIMNGGEPKRAILIRLEPETVFPKQYRSSVKSKYGLIITPGAILESDDSTYEIGWPYQFHPNPASPQYSDPTLESILEDSRRQTLYQIENWRIRPITLSMVAANKVSPLMTTNYSLRRKLASRIPKDLIQIYGQLWNDGLFTKVHHRLAVMVTALRQGTLPSPIGIYGNLFKSYPSTLGSVKDKHLVLQQSKFSLVVENTNSYVSEKLFDVMLNAAIPIYVGPKLEDVGLPSEIAIQSSGNPEEITEIVRTINEEDAEAILNAMQEYFKTSLFRNSWSESSVYQKIASRISLYVAKLKT
jgi:hypothetical protein